MIKKLCLAFVCLGLLVSIADAGPFRTRSRAVARTGGVRGGTKAKAKATTRKGPVRVTENATTEQVIASATPGSIRWRRWSDNSKQDTPGQGRQNDQLQ